MTWSAHCRPIEGRLDLDDVAVVPKSRLAISDHHRNLRLYDAKGQLSSKQDPGKRSKKLMEVKHRRSSKSCSMKTPPLNSSTFNLQGLRRHLEAGLGRLRPQPRDANAVAQVVVPASCATEFGPIGC